MPIDIDHRTGAIGRDSGRKLGTYVLYPTRLSGESDDGGALWKEDRLDYDRPWG